MAANNLNHDQLWTADVWQDIDQAVLAEVGPTRVLQKVITPTPMPGAVNVPADKFDPDKMSMLEGLTKPFLEISVHFSLTQGQVDNECTLHTARTLAKLAAKNLALAEDSLFFQGKDAPLPPKVRVVNKDSADHGLLGAAATRYVHVPALAGKAGVYGEEIFRAVTRGIAELIKVGQPGPFALILQSEIYADTYAPVRDSLAIAADRLIPLLTGGFYGTGTLPESTGLLFSLCGEPTSIFVAADATTAYTQEDEEGSFRFLVFERVQYIARDHRAIIKLDFEKKP
jgi:uncharacterized linocin/CFP29 family protein